MNRQMYKNVLFIAPTSVTSTNRTASYSGTGLPFPCAEIAFDGSPNIYNVDLSGNIDATFTYPNSYYTMGTIKKIVSSVFVVIEDLNGKYEFVRLQLQDLYPLRTLVDREERLGPEFYEIKHHILPVDTAEAVMKAYAASKSIYKIA